MMEQNKRLQVGDYIQSYRITGIYNGCCIAHSRTAPFPYAVWTLDNDGCGVYNGRYRDTLEQAEMEFMSSSFRMDGAFMSMVRLALASFSPEEELSDSSEVSAEPGKWLEDEYGYFSCPYCHFEWDDPEYFKPFCPECGARLEGAE